MFETNRHNKKGMKTRPSAVFLRRCKWADNGAPGRRINLSDGISFLRRPSICWPGVYHILAKKKRKKRVNNWIVTSSGPVLSVWSSSSGPLMRACVSSALSSLSNVITVSKQTNRRRTKKRTHREREMRWIWWLGWRNSVISFSHGEKRFRQGLLFTPYIDAIRGRCNTHRPGRLGNKRNCGLPLSSSRRTWEVPTPRTVSFQWQMQMES